MKKLLILVIFIVTLCINGCAENVVSSKNEIAPKALTKEQDDLINLISADKLEILLFDYKTKNSYKSVEFWVETYENGVLIDRPAGVSMFNDELRPLNGQVAILINRSPGYHWSFTISDGSSRINHSSEPLSTDYEMFGRAFGPIDEPAIIEDNKEIVLYTSIFSKGNVSIYGDKQIYAEQPELLEDYPYAHIIKCKFEN